MFFRTLHAEWVKLSTTKALYINTVIYLLLTGLMAWMTGKLQAGMNPPFVLIAPALEAITSLTAVFPMVIAVMIVTSEYRFRTIGVTFSATPKRAIVIAAKLALALIYTFISTLAATVIAYLSYKWGVGPDYSMMVDLTVPYAVHSYWTVPAGVCILAIFALAVALLVRQTAGAAIAVIMWYFVVEAMLNLIPKIGNKLYQWAPANHTRAFMIDTATGEHLTATQSGLYAFGFAMVLLLVAAMVTIKRDA